MLDIVIAFVENVSPDYMALPFMFLKAEGWHGDPGPRRPTTEELIERIKTRKEESGQERVRLHQYNDKEIIEMLASAPIEVMMRVKDDICLQEVERTGIRAIFTSSRPKDNLQVALAKALTLNSTFVKYDAMNLSHKPDKDYHRVDEWGLDVEHALGRFLNTSLERVRKNSYHQQNRAGQPTEELKDVLETHRVNVVRRSLIKARLSMPPMWPFTQGGQHFAAKNRKSVMRVMDFDTRMTHALSVLSRLEESCKDDISAGKSRIKRYENTQETISKFYELLETQHDALDGEAGRLKREEAEEFQSGGDPSDKLRAKFRDMSLTVKEDIAERLHALRKTLHVCEIEYGAYQTMIAAEKNSWESINHLTRTQIPMFRQQLMQAQNIKAGRVAVQMDGLSSKMQKLSGQKLRDAAADEIIDGVCAEIKTAADALDDISENEIRAITKAETLMIEDQRPVALIEKQDAEPAAMT